MRWFKHQAQLRRDPDIADYMARCGRDRVTGYGMLMMVMEVVAERMDAQSSQAAVIYPTSTWLQLCGVHALTWHKYAKLMRSSGVVSIEEVEGNCRVEIPKLLLWRDEYSRKSGQSPESLRTMSHQREKRREADTDIDKEGEQKPDPPALARSVYQNGRTARPLTSQDPQQSLPQKVDARLTTYRDLYLTRGGEVNADRLARDIHRGDGYSSEPSPKFIRAVQRCVAANGTHRTQGEAAQP